MLKSNCNTKCSMLCSPLSIQNKSIYTKYMHLSTPYPQMLCIYVDKRRKKGKEGLKTARLSPIVSFFGERRRALRSERWDA